jgi:hypothetical protein
MSEDGLKGDIDVDYRSSKSPQSFFNGHLTSANSDVRAGDNPTRHNGRWQGLVLWWRDLFSRLPESLPKQEDLLGLDRPDAPPGPLPPDRPANTTTGRIEEAAQEFLSDWLIRRDYDRALSALSPRIHACVNLTDDARPEALDVNDARREFRRILEYAGEKLGARRDLTSTIAAFTPRDPNRPVIDHPFRQEFLLMSVPETEARQFLCDASTPQPSGLEYFGVIFTFRIEGGGTLALLWSREGDRWKIVAYEPLEL